MTASSLSVVVVGFFVGFCLVEFFLSKVYALVTYPKLKAYLVGMGIQIVTVYRLSKRLPFIYRVF